MYTLQCNGGTREFGSGFVALNGDSFLERYLCVAGMHSRGAYFLFGLNLLAIRAPAGHCAAAASPPLL
jgi:hypothetical protein